MVGRLGLFIRANEPDSYGWENFLLGLRRSRLPGKRFFWNGIYWVLVIGNTATLACYETITQSSYRLIYSLLVGIVLSLVAVGMTIQDPPGEKTKS
jgi:hypothetical protein